MIWNFILDSPLIHDEDRKQNGKRKDGKYDQVQIKFIWRSIFRGDHEYSTNRYFAISCYANEDMLWELQTIPKICKFGKMRSITVIFFILVFWWRDEWTGWMDWNFSFLRSIISPFHRHVYFLGIDWWINLCIELGFAIEMTNDWRAKCTFFVS